MFLVAYAAWVCVYRHVHRLQACVYRLQRCVYSNSCSIPDSTPWFNFLTNKLAKVPATRDYELSLSGEYFDKETKRELPHGWILIFYGNCYNLLQVLSNK
jgi:hypothetical protein